MNAYQVSKFGGNLVTVQAESPAEAVRMVIKAGVVEVFPDGFYHVNGEPCGWVMIMEKKEEDTMAEEKDYKALYEQAVKEKESLQEQIRQVHEADKKQREYDCNVSEFTRRVKCLKSMEYLMRSMNNGRFIDGWLMCGVPDGADESIYGDMASDVGMYTEAVETFIRTMRLSLDPSDYFAFSHLGKGDTYGPDMREYPNLYTKDIYGFKLTSDRYTVEVRTPDDGAIWRLTEKDVSRVIELLGTFKEVEASREEE